ncbi:MAG: N-acetylmuramoyl-L-alanine amidase [Neomegalonema sp.]|nr:N-acetylmuramoyl-L-alanine amidase [Neomegalonema sp.]
MQSAGAARDRLCQPEAQVSAHYLIEQDGAILAMVDEQARAWHAGRAMWQGIEDINSRSIGIELVNGGHDFGQPPFPEAQMRALETLLRDLRARWQIPASNVLGHSDIAPGRKRDPGEKFDWHRLAREGLAVMPERGKAPLHSPMNWREAMRRIGYGDWPEPALLDALRLRYAPERLGTPACAADDATAFAAFCAFRPKAIDREGIPTAGS